MFDCVKTTANLSICQIYSGMKSPLEHASCPPPSVNKNNNLKNLNNRQVVSRFFSIS